MKMNFDFLKTHKFSYIDIGGANFNSTRFDFIGDYNVFEFGLSDKEGCYNLHLTRKPECSSILKPNRRIIDLYPNAERFDVMEVVDIHCKNLDGIEDLRVDFLKIDVQGYELPILIGAKDKLEECLGLELEVYFRPFYENQPLFADIDLYLRNCGFELMDIKNLKHFARDGYYGAGELIFGDAVYVKSINSILSESEMVREKLFIINYAYENYSYAETILLDLYADVGNVLRASKKRQFRSKLREYWLKKIGVIR